MAGANIGEEGAPASKELGELGIRRIVTDGDLDGVMTAAILRRMWPDSEVVFGHPGAIRAGLLDDSIDRETAICDLPSHPAAGLLIDHHVTNRPKEEDGGGDRAGPDVVLWRDTPSAARIAHDEVGRLLSLSDLDDAMDWVDKLDGGTIGRDEYLSDHPMIRIGRLVDADSNPKVARAVLAGFERGDSPERILSEPSVAAADTERRDERGRIRAIIDRSTEVINRLAIVRFDGTGSRTNGYEVTARIGDACDACLLVHGWIDGSLADGGRPPLGASFYTNSFLHRGGGIVDLTTMACAIDDDGGGHRDACGCRIKAIDDDGGLELRRPVAQDINRNLDIWLSIWRCERSNAVE